MSYTECVQNMFHTGGDYYFLKQLPNILSCCRIILSLYLFTVYQTKPWFLILYTACGLTDIADGYIARKSHNVTALGARLDSLADLVFSMAILYLTCVRVQSVWGQNFIIGAMLILGTRIVNVLITRLKFKQWNVIHTIANKATGLILFSILPVYYVLGFVPAVVIITFLIVALLSSLEETGILLLAEYYDVNRKSLFVPY